MESILLQTTKKKIISWESHLFAVLAILIGSNAYFVQRVISQLDLTTSQMHLLTEKVGRIEVHLEDLAEIKKAEWKK